MKIKMGTKVLINHARKGVFKGIALKDFDTQKEEFYPIVLAEKSVSGMNTNWEKGEQIPCRCTLCSIQVVKE